MTPTHFRGIRERSKLDMMQLAKLLGVTTQAVSLWEWCRRMLPPLFAALGRMVSQLAPICNSTMVDRFFLSEKCPDDYLDALGTVLDPILAGGNE